MRRSVIIFLVGPASLWLCACGSTGSSTDGSGGDARADGKAADGAALGDSSLHRDGASDSGAQGDAGGVYQDAEAGIGNCTSTTCLPSDICVQSQVSGGAIIESDAGVCPPGTEPEPGSAGRCMNDPTTRCATRPSGCGSAVTCACAGTLCPAAFTCEDSADASIWTAPCNEPEGSLQPRACAGRLTPGSR
jgi:hypothetical protein